MPGLSRLRGRSPFGAAKPRTCCTPNVYGRDEPGHDDQICRGAAYAARTEFMNLPTSRFRRLLSVDND
jgi:hypothetical protein